MSFGVDTSVLVRLLTGEPPELCARATARLLEEHRRQVPVISTDMALAEAYFALKYHYKAEPAAIRGRMLAMLTSGLIRPEAGSAAIEVLRSDEGGSAGLIDRLIHGRHRKAGATTLTFDRHQAKPEGAERIV